MICLPSKVLLSKKTARIEEFVNCKFQYDLNINVTPKTKISLVYNSDIVIGDTYIELTKRNETITTDEKATTLNVEFSFDKLRTIEKEPKFKKILQNIGVVNIQVSEPDGVGELSKPSTLYSLVVMIHYDAGELCYTFIQPDDS